MLTKGQKKYSEEYEKYKDVEIKQGLYVNKNRPIIQYEVLSVGVGEVVLKTFISGNVTKRKLKNCLELE